MFKTPNVSAYLQKLTFSFEATRPLAHASFYITPISHGLAHEINPHLADDLFRRKGAEYVPRKEVPTMGFELEIEPQAMNYAVSTAVTTGRGLIPHVKLDKLRAFRLFADSDDFTLAFDAAFVCESKELVWAILNRGKKPLLLTFSALQAGLDFPDVIPLCEICEKPATHRTKPGKSLVCAEHVGAYIGEEVEPLDPDYEAKSAAAVNKTVEGAKKKAAGKKKKAAKKKK